MVKINLEGNQAEIHLVDNKKLYAVKDGRLIVNDLPN